MEVSAGWRIYSNIEVKQPPWNLTLCFKHFLLTGHNPSMFGSIGILASSGNYSLWSKAREHSYQKLQKMWDKGYWSREQLLSHGQLVPICTITFLSSSWSNHRPSVWPKDWHLVSWLYLGWAMLWGSMSSFCFVSVIKIKFECNSTCFWVWSQFPVLFVTFDSDAFVCYQYQEIHPLISEIFWAYMCSPGAVSKWFSCNDPCTHDWAAWPHWSGDVGTGAGDTQVFHKRIRSLSHKWGLFPIFSVLICEV